MIDLLPRTRWRVSAAWLNRRHECNLTGILARCGGACCYAGPARLYWPARAYDRPNGACGNLGPTGCTLTPADKPVTCHLYPLKLNANGTLVLHQRAVFPKGICKGNHGNGPALIDVLAPNLTALLGELEYARLRASVLAGADCWVDVPPDIAAALEAEEREAAANLPPTPRSQR